MEKEVGVEAVAKRGVEATLTAGAEVEVTHTAVREADLTLIPPTILEAVPDLHHFTRVRGVDPTTPPILQGQGPEQGLGLPPSCEEEALLAFWTSDGSQVHENDQCRTTGQPQAHLPPHLRVELQHALLHQLEPTVDPKRGQTVENRIPPVMISSMLNCVIYSSFKCSCSNLVTKETRQFSVQRLTCQWAANIQLLR